MRSGQPPGGGVRKTRPRLVGWIAPLLLASAAATPVPARAADAAPPSGPLHWQDGLVRPHPALVEVRLPDQTAVPWRYWIDLSHGTGTACTQLQPCAALRDLLGKPGTLGGPAYVYLRGSGRLYLYGDQFHGAPGREIVLVPWGSDPVTVRPGANGSSLSGAGVHDLVVDGGPDLAIHWVNDAGGDNFALHLRADNVTIRRTEGWCTVPDVSGVIAAGDYGVIHGLRILNNDFHDCGARPGQQASALYLGPGDGGGYDGAEVTGNLIHSMGGEGIEVNPRVTSRGLRIVDNVIQDVGKQTCLGRWGCRPGITLGAQSGGGNDGAELAGNTIRDVGSDCVWERGGGTPPARLTGNTCIAPFQGQGAGAPEPVAVRLAHGLGLTRARLLRWMWLGLPPLALLAVWLTQRRRGGAS